MVIGIKRPELTTNQNPGISFCVLSVQTIVVVRQFGFVRGVKFFDFHLNVDRRTA